MRENPLVCVSFEEIRNSWDWFTVIITGTYEELSNTNHSDLRETAYRLLSKQRAVWWEPATIKCAGGDGAAELELIYFRIHTTARSGHRAVPDPAVVEDRPSRLSRWLMRKAG
jgi:nitroimidazol reductase NimA-like FMN-containing flavoprotein (pyridoxamine 5'-phosphate oxidase superfamily)